MKATHENRHIMSFFSSIFLSLIHWYKQLNTLKNDFYIKGTLTKVIGGIFGSRAQPNVKEPLPRVLVNFILLPF